MRQIENPAQFRENIRKKLETILGDSEVAMNLEKGIFNSSLGKAKEKCIVKKLKLVGPELDIGTHSLRASGATNVANASSVSERCLKIHGRWKTDIAKDGYVQDSIDKRLSVTKTLNL